MTNPTTTWATILCIDWAKSLRKRRAWVADVAGRTVRPLDDGPWTLGRAIDVAKRLPGPVLVGIDAALGVPAHYFARAVAEIPAFRDAVDFPTWVARAVKHPGFLDEAPDASAWRVDRPFIAVPPGTGALRRFWDAAGARLLRAVDVSTGAKSPFVVSGIPGTVGSGSRALWTELAPLLATERSFHLWPFDGPLLSRRHPVAVAEIYPRVCYALALDDAAPGPLRALAKTQVEVRKSAVAELPSCAWVRRTGTTFEALETTVEGDLAEDDFDAMMSAAALLRASLEGLPLERSGGRDVAVEGDILGVASVTLGAARPR